MQQLTEPNYRQIILRRDPHYDGRLYFGVKTTKIYCRPVWPARPKYKNIIVYRSASAAEKVKSSRSYMTHCIWNKYAKILSKG